MELINNRLINERFLITKDHWPDTQNVIDVLVAIDIDQLAPVPAPNKKGCYAGDELIVGFAERL